MKDFMYANRQLSTVIVQAQQQAETKAAANDLLDSKLTFDTCDMTNNNTGLWLCSLLEMYKAASHIDTAAVEATGQYVKAAYLDQHDFRYKPSL